MYRLKDGLLTGSVAALLTELMSVLMERAGGGTGEGDGVSARHELLSVRAPMEDARVARPSEPNMLVIPVAVLWSVLKVEKDLSVSVSVGETRKTVLRSVRTVPMER